MKFETYLYESKLNAIEKCESDVIFDLNSCQNHLVIYLSQTEIKS